MKKSAFFFSTNDHHYRRQRWRGCQRNARGCGNRGKFSHPNHRLRQYRGQRSGCNQRRGQLHTDRGRPSHPSKRNSDRKRPGRGDAQFAEMEAAALSGSHGPHPFNGATGAWINTLDSIPTYDIARAKDQSVRDASIVTMATEMSPATI